MPEPRGLGAPRRRARAISAVETWIASLPGTKRPLAAHELAKYASRFVQGWRFDVGFEDRTRRLDLLLDSEYPRSEARLAIVDRPEFLTWPHVEEDGLLCLLPATGTVSTASELAAVQGLFRDAVDLVQDCASGVNQQDLRDEFTSYWARAATGSARPTFSLVAPAGPSRLVRVWLGDRFSVVGDDVDAVTAWLRNKTAPDRKYATVPGVLVWPERAPLPREYPSTGLDVLSLVRANAPEIVPELERFATEGDHSIVVLIGVTTSSGPCFGAVTIDPPRIGHALWGKVDKPLSRGFRPGNVPVHVAVRRRFNTTACRATVERADAAWVHGRGLAPRQALLREKRVVVLGCGSVGAPVALALAQAGVGTLELVDPEALSFANVGRHPLGAEDVGRSKAVALASRLRARFPHAAGIRGHARRWAASRENLALLGSADLVVSAMGDWASEGAVNEWHVVTGRKNKILYAWTEAHACAGHAVLISARGGCLQCGLDDHGASRLPVTEWPNGSTMRTVPGCGAMFQPYGPVELSHITSVGSELAIEALLGSLETSVHRVWAARKAMLDACGGVWSRAWLDEGAPESGGLVRERTWDAVASCPECGRRSAA
jgi:sulfur-carrier protein adenylyltransferase/sulfurtransferase